MVRDRNAGLGNSPGRGVLAVALVFFVAILLVPTSVSRAAAVGSTRSDLARAAFAASAPARESVGRLPGAFGETPTAALPGSARTSFRTAAFALPSSPAAPASPAARALRQSLTEASSSSPAPARSPRLSFLLSAILPGAGQLYNANSRGYVFLALDAASWFTRSSYLDAADRKEADARAFADRHWDFDRFVGAEGNEGCGFPPGADTLLAGYFEDDRNQYYEELANGDEYRCGWDDARFDPESDRVLSDRRVEYREQRDRQNTFENRAGLALGVLVLNRIVSAVDAFRLARGRDAGEAPSLRLTSELGREEGGPRAVFRLTKEFP